MAISGQGVQVARQGYQVVNLCNFKIMPCNFPNCAKHRAIYLHVEQVITVFANGARERLLSSLERQYGRKSLEG